MLSGSPSGVCEPPLWAAVQVYFTSHPQSLPGRRESRAETGASRTGGRGERGGDLHGGGMAGKQIHQSDTYKEKATETLTCDVGGPGGY